MPHPESIVIDPVVPNKPFEPTPDLLRDPPPGYDEIPGDQPGSQPTIPPDIDIFSHHL